MDLKKQAEFSDMLCRQMGIEDKSELDKWKVNSYPVNSKTVSVFWDYIKKTDNILVVGDYDVDGVCASYIMTKAIKMLFPKKRVGVRIPHRMSEGYGFSEKIADEIQRRMPKESLIITVDNGIAAAEVLENLKKDGYSVIVTDHHELGNRKIPDVDMVLDPKVDMPNQPFTGDYWCGAAVALKLCETVVTPALHREFEIFAAIATVADCMKLTKGNWALVRRGVDYIKEGNAPQSIIALLTELGQSPENVTEETFGYYLGPAINAPGRLLDDGAKISLGYFISPTSDKCKKLVQYNSERKALRDIQLEMVEEYIKENHLKSACPIWVYIPGLHEGIVGILAGKVTEKYNVPSIVLTDVEGRPGYIKGSARSVGDVNIFEHLIKLDAYIEKFGGHDLAAGLTMKKENFDYAASVSCKRPDIKCSNIILDIDRQEIPDMAYINECFRPFGEGNPQPKFHINVDLKQENSTMIGKPPLHLCITDPLKQYKIMHFYHIPNNLANKNLFSLTGGIRYDVYNGKKTAALTADEIEDYGPDDKDYEISDKHGF